MTGKVDEDLKCAVLSARTDLFVPGGDDYSVEHNPREVDTSDFCEALDLILTSRFPHRGLDILDWSGILEKMLPEIAALKTTSQESGRKHKDVWKHTKTVVRQAISTSALRWAALFHDVGKPPTVQIKGNKVTFYNHDIVGARMWNTIARRLGVSEEFRNKVWFLVRHHLRVSQYDSSWTDSAVRRFYKEMGEHIDDILSLARADVTTGRLHKRSKIMYLTKELSLRVEKLKEEDSRPKALPKGLGTEIAAALQIEPGPALGTLVKKIKDAVERGELEARREPPYYIEWLRNDGRG